MPPQRPITPTSLSHLEVMLTDDGSRTLRDCKLNETYHSGCGALSECWHVYLQNSGVLDLLISRRSEPVRVLEMGFGTGMGWLITAVAAAVHGAALEYVSLESDLLPADVLAQIDTSAAVSRGIADGWIPKSFAVMETVERGWLDYRHSLSIANEIAYRVSAENGLRLILGDAKEWFHQRSLEPFDAIYFDAFSPGTNPELWREELLASVRTQLRPGGKLVSYCVSGAVRRALQDAGFAVQRLSGPPGGKREVLLCVRHGDS